MSVLENEARRANQENREARENKEKEVDPELSAAAALERADFLVREVKTSKNQMQNIVVHMQAVLQAIRELRQALQIPASTNDESSIVQDKKRVEDLKNKIVEYRVELKKMKVELIDEHYRKLQEKNPGQDRAILQAEAESMVNRLYSEVEIED